MRENGDSEQLLITSLTLAHFQLKSNHRPFSYIVLKTQFYRRTSASKSTTLMYLSQKVGAEYMFPSTL